jgi:hypothetical protein
VVKALLSMRASSRPTPTSIARYPVRSGTRISIPCGQRTGGQDSHDDGTAYDDQVYVDDRTIDSPIKRLRIKFRASDVEFDMIETLYGVGYRFKEV